MEIWCFEESGDFEPVLCELESCFQGGVGAFEVLEWGEREGLDVVFVADLVDLLGCCVDGDVLGFAVCF